MRYLILFLLLVPFTAFAGHHHKPPSPPVIPPVVIPTPPPVVVPPPTPLPPPPVPQPPPAIIPANGQIWCSGPTAPGYNINLPGGGCSPTTVTQIAKPLGSGVKLIPALKETPLKRVALSAVPYTGDTTTLFEYFGELLLSFFSYTRVAL